MKRWSTTPAKIRQLTTRSALVAGAVMMVIAAPIQVVHADSIDEKIRAIQAQVEQFNAQAAQLKAQGDNLQNAVNALVAQKNAIQSEIDLNQAKYEQLVAEIQANEVKLDKQKKSLNKTIAQIYANGNTTPIEMLATSKNVGEYVAAQEVRSSIRNQMKSAMDRIKKLQAELDTQRKQVEQVLADQKSRRDQLAAKEAEQANLLAQTRGEEAAYQNLISQKQGEIQQLYDQQRASLTRAGGRISAGDPGRGGYPSNLANAPLDSMVDPWGMYNRECVSYTAWKVHEKTGNMPYWGGVGNARQWPGNADAAGISRGPTPRVDSVAIIYNVYSGDQYGHAAWVKSVNGGSVTVSQYNWGSPGSYSEMTVPASFFDTYIYF